MAAKKKEIEFRYYEIPQNEPCIALLGEAWVRPYGMDSLHFHNYMEIGFCYDGIGELAQESHMSETHFRRVFQKIMNMTPSDYLNLVRVQMACEYMKKHTDSMELVAERCGFQSVSTFNRNFKKVLNITPYQWKIHPENYEAKLLDYKISAYKGW